MVAGLASEQCVTSVPEIESFRAAKWHLAIDFAARGNNLHSFCPAVERIPPSRRSAAEKFVPIRFVFRYKLAGDDRLMIASDGLALSEM